MTSVKLDACMTTMGRMTAIVEIVSSVAVTAGMTMKTTIAMTMVMTMMTVASPVLRTAPIGTETTSATWWAGAPRFPRW